MVLRIEVTLMGFRALKERMPKFGSRVPSSCSRALFRQRRMVAQVFGKVRAISAPAKNTLPGKPVNIIETAAGWALPRDLGKGGICAFLQPSGIP